MKRLLLAAGFALVATVAHAQEGPATSAPATSQQKVEAQASISGHIDLVYRVPQPYPVREKGKHDGDPPIIDHSADLLIVEPTHSTITLTNPSPP